MNKKHINAQLCKKFEDFLCSIEDEEVRNKVDRGTIITGGALVSLLQGEAPHDYDLYFRDFDTCYTVAEYYVKEFNKTHNKKARLETDEKERIRIFIQSEGVAGDFEDDTEEMETNIEPSTNIEAELETEPKYIPKFLTSNAISLSGKVQLVIRFYGEPEKIHENYDYVHCTNYWTSWERKVVLNPYALECIINKELIYIGSKYPLCSIIRSRKFINRGWTINAGQYLKMCMQLNELDLTSIDVLQDQLVGVDSTYFAMLIEALQNKKEKEPGFAVNSSYVANIIDKIF